MKYIDMHKNARGSIYVILNVKMNDTVFMFNRTS